MLFSMTKLKPLKSGKNVGSKLANQEMANFPESSASLRTLLGFQFSYKNLEETSAKDFIFVSLPILVCKYARSSCCCCCVKETLCDSHV